MSAVALETRTVVPEEQPLLDRVGITTSAVTSPENLNSDSILVTTPPPESAPELKTETTMEDHSNNHTEGVRKTNGADAAGGGTKTPPSPARQHKYQSHFFAQSPQLSKSLGSAQLRGNLTRALSNRDPLFYYEIVRVLGVGSMGSVAMVRKRAEIVGGSARKDVQDYFRVKRQREACFQIPIIGGFFAFCFRKLGMNENDSLRSSGGSRNPRMMQGWGSSILRPQAANFLEVTGQAASTDSGDGSNLSSGGNRNGSGYSSGSGGNGEGTNGGKNGEKRNGGKDMLYAMKSIHLSRVTDPSFVNELRNEIAILKTLDHPHIVRAMEQYEHRNQLFIVMELCQGGDLYTRDPYTEPEAARITSSILSAIAYMHSYGIVHRDLKYENILFVNTSPRAEIKLIDFGLSATFGQDALTDGVGTVYTMAPEVFKNSYDKQADLWSVGVVAFMLISSQMPFYGRKRKHIIEQIMKGDYKFKGRRWKRVSQQAKAFIQDLLVVDPDDRLTADEALSASWLNRRFSATMRSPHEEEEESAALSMIKYSNYAKLKRVALMVVAHKSTSEEIGILRKVFQKYDQKRDGCLNYDEFRAALDDAGYTEEQYRQIFDAVDLDGSGRIRYTEFLAATIEAQGAISEERLAEAFDRIDSDDSGYISKENLKEMLGEEFPSAEIDAIMEEADLNHCGKISYAQFLALWEDQKETKRSEAIHELEQMVDNDSERNDDSDLIEEYSKEEVEARHHFLNGKKESIRRVDVERSSSRRVMFDDNVEEIPRDPLESAESTVEADGEKAAETTDRGS